MTFFSKQNNSHKNFFRLKTTLSIFALVVFSLAIFSLATPVLAQTLDTGLEYGRQTGLGTQDLRVTIMRIIQIFLGLVGIIAIILTVYAGFVWMTSAGNPERIDTAKRILRGAVIGLVIIFSAFSIVSFIIGQLQSALFGSPGGGGPPTDGGCVNCANLGGGLIERVYPEPFARDVARNTAIMVTFKIDIDPASVVDGCSSLPCSGDIASDPITNNQHVLIYREALEAGDTLQPNEVIASTKDGKTFVFKPRNSLGNPDANTWYVTELTTDIRKPDGDTALTFGNFSWKFEIGTQFDIDPPYITGVFPEPDSVGDEYTFVNATSAQWELDVREVPQALVIASYTQPTPATTGLTVTGNYTGTQNSTIIVTINADGTANVNWGVGSVNNNPSVTPSAGVINLGGGLSLNSTSGYAAGSQWTISVTAAQTSDVLRIGNTNYTFVSSSPQANQLVITSSDTTITAAEKIRDEINTNISGLSASVTGDVVNVTADVAGLSGNLFVFSQTGDWVAITKTQNGAPAGLNPVPNSSPVDKARNAVFIIDFNEPINPDELTLDNFIIGYYDEFDNFEPVTDDANFQISNQYKTIEIFSNVVCENDSGQQIINSCGDEIYCWPVNALSQANPQPTRYEIIMRAGALQTCNSDSDCLDPNFPACQLLHNSSAVKVCSGEFNAGVDVSGNPVTQVAYYPSVSDTPNGISDATSPGNSFNANKDTYTLPNKRTHGKADGPINQNASSIFNLNDKSGFGDDIIWSFYLNTNIDLTPPVINAIKPDVLSGNVSLLDPIDANFSEIMLSSSLKPGSNYQDGQCGCDPANNDAATGINTVDCNSSQTCNIQGVCENLTGPQEYCANDLECSTNSCVNKKYVSLVDQSTPAVGWWVNKNNIDTNNDGAFDATTSHLQHTRFLESSNYGAEFGSGIKDAYQNCYQPSSSEPPVGTPILDPSLIIPPACAGSPYCCNGAPMTESQWEASTCFTGY